jgi:hypothetical protein
LFNILLQSFPTALPHKSWQRTAPGQPSCGATDVGSFETFAAERNPASRRPDHTDIYNIQVCFAVVHGSNSLIRGGFEGELQG